MVKKFVFSSAVIDALTRLNRPIALDELWERNREEWEPKMTGPTKKKTLSGTLTRLAQANRIKRTMSRVGYLFTALEPDFASGEMQVEPAVAVAPKKKRQATTIKIKTMTRQQPAKQRAAAPARTVAAPKRTIVKTPVIVAKKASVTKPTKRPLNAYMRFAKDARAGIVRAHPNMRVTDVAKELGRQYQALSAAEKEEYKAKALKEFAAKH
jgi:hypothetical protein